MVSVDHEGGRLPKVSHALSPLHLLIVSSELPPPPSPLWGWEWDTSLAQQLLHPLAMMHGSQQARDTSLSQRSRPENSTGTFWKEISFCWAARRQASVCGSLPLPVHERNLCDQGGKTGKQPKDIFFKKRDIADGIIWRPGSGLWLQISKVFRNRTINALSSLNLLCHLRSVVCGPSLLDWWCITP